MLSIASELEHALMCEYLYAAMSLKRRPEEGLTQEQLARVNHWRAAVMRVAKQEMLHLAIACNLSTAVGGSPHLSRPNLPHPARHYPPGVRLALLPFGEAALRHFLFLERPEDIDLDDAEGIAAAECALPVTGADEIAPHLQEFQTVGHLYHAIEAGLRHLAERLGEDRLFLTGAAAQTSGAAFGWKELAPITDLASAVRSLEAVVEQGEGSRGDWRESHFGQFLAVLEDHMRFTQEFPGVDVTRPVLPVLVRPPESGEALDVITDPDTARVADLANIAYEVLLKVLSRLMAHVDETESQATTLARVSVAMMYDVIEPLADILTTMPVGAEHPGRTA
jgi:hypothetical protein